MSALKERCLSEIFSFLKHALEHEMEASLPPLLLLLVHLVVKCATCPPPRAREQVEALRQELAGKLDLRSAFRLLDSDDKGYITAADIRSFVAREKPRAQRGGSVPAEALMALLRQFDQDGDGCWSPTEWMQMLRVEAAAEGGGAPTPWHRSPSSDRGLEDEPPSPAGRRTLARLFEAELAAFARSELDRRLLASAGVTPHEAVLALQVRRAWAARASV